MFVTDLDDTLYKEEEFVLSAARTIAGAVGRSGLMTQDQALATLLEVDSMGKGMDRLAAQLWEADPQTTMDVGWMVNLYRTHLPDIHLVAGAKQTLERLKGEGVALGLITDGRSLTQRNKIKALGIEGYFKPENIIISEEVGGDKNTPVPFDTLMKRNPSELQFLYFGDNPAKDFYWPNRLGWTTVQLNNCGGVNVFAQDLALSPDQAPMHKVDTYAEVVKWLTVAPPPVAAPAAAVAASTASTAPQP